MNLLITLTTLAMVCIQKALAQTVTASLYALAWKPNANITRVCFPFHFSYYQLESFKPNYQLSFNWWIESRDYLFTIILTWAPSVRKYRCSPTDHECRLIQGYPANLAWHWARWRFCHSIKQRQQPSRHWNLELGPCLSVSSWHNSGFQLASRWDRSLISHHKS